VNLPQLILLPGLDGTGKLFAEFVRVLAPSADTRVIAYPTGLPLGYDELETRVRAALPRRRFVLLAESFSGPIAIRIAANPPPDMLGVILCGTFARNPFPLLKWARPIAAYAPVNAVPRWLRALIMWGSAKPATAPARADRAMAGVASVVVRRRISALIGVDATDALRRIALPVLVVHGRGDRIITRRSAEWIMEHARQAEIVWIDGPHLLLQSRPRECAIPVLAFLRRCDPGDPD
jgi:pimeloyl-ACP methyl ester carboxylesterase